ncbi:Fur family transcriptional regulator [Sulfurihydrogenibium sp.]|uniref:Fur family transcriptional regulator n=1 Tax=Sulfurihydrogenibium sp. TaxID=2053621 RepID=UPI000CC9CF53|nr:MAG: transcriptional repressor [Sulfurihydrogenibium sp.]
MEKLKIPKGYKTTKQRKAILEILEENITPMHAEDIYLKLKEKGIDVSLSTIYRNLDMLQKQGLVVKAYMLNEDKARFGLSSKKNYLICKNCKKIVIIDNCPFEKFKEELMEVHGFDILEHSIEVYGICPDCKKQKANE